MKKLLVALAVGVAVFAAAYASAASLGLTSNDLGADDQVVASCDTSVIVTYQTSYHATSTAYPNGAYLVDSVTLDNLDEAGCSGQTITITLSGNSVVSPNPPAASTASLTELQKVCCDNTDSDTEVLSVIGNAVGAAEEVNAESVQGVHVVITGS